jgi:hypothetical protein
MNDIGMKKVCMYSELLFRYRNDVDKFKLDGIIDSLQCSFFITTVRTVDDMRILHRASLEKGEISREGEILK